MTCGSDCACMHARSFSARLSERFAFANCYMLPFNLNCDSLAFCRDGFEDLVEDGQVVWVESVKPRSRSSSYGE